MKRYGKVGMDSAIEKQFGQTSQSSGHHQLEFTTFNLLNSPSKEKNSQIQMIYTSIDTKFDVEQLLSKNYCSKCNFIDSETKNKH